MDERTKKAILRTHDNAVRHLEDLNDAVDRDGGRIKDHMTLDGMKDAVKVVCKTESLMKENPSFAR